LRFLKKEKVLEKGGGSSAAKKKLTLPRKEKTGKRRNPRSWSMKEKEKKTIRVGEGGSHGKKKELNLSQQKKKKERGKAILNSYHCLTKRGGKFKPSGKKIRKLVGAGKRVTCREEANSRENVNPSH